MLSSDDESIADPAEHAAELTGLAGTIRVGTVYPSRRSPDWPRAAISLADRVVPAGWHGPIQPSSIEYRLGHFALHEGVGPRALALMHDMLVSDLHYVVREGLCDQAMLASHCTVILARFDALRRGVNRAVDDGEDAVWVCEPVDREAVISNRVRPDREHSGRANSAPVASQPTYGARRSNRQTIRPEPYDVLDTTRFDGIAFSSRRNPVP